MTQRTLDFCDYRIPHQDRPRLAGQCAKILERLKQGPATNYELSAISLKYTSRVSDLRNSGFVVVCRRGEGGTTVYRLLEE